MPQQVGERKVRFEPQMRRREGDSRKLVGFTGASPGFANGLGILGRHAAGKTFEDL